MKEKSRTRRKSRVSLKSLATRFSNERVSLKSLLTRTLHQSYFVVALAAGVIVGTILGLVFRINFFQSPLWPVVTILLFLYAYFHPTYTFMVIAFVAGLILSFFRIATELKGENYIRTFYDETVVVTGEVEGDPNQDEEKNATKVALKNLSFGEDEKQETAGMIYATLRRTEEIARGDRVTLKGKLSAGFGTYAGYFYQPTVLKIERPTPGDPVLKIRNWFAMRVQKNLSETEAALGLSYLLGMKTGLPDELNENLRIVGLVHIVVASGAHLSILVEVAKKLFGKLSRFAALLGSLIFILFFMSLVGWTPSILRAGVMASLTLVAWYVGRKFAPWRIILLVAAFTLILNPMFIINLGWLLSFASFSGIMILGPKLTRFFYGTKKPKFIASTIITTLAATLLTLPITLYYYGTVSLISLAANLLILPTLPYAMGLVFLAGATAGLPGIEVATAWVATKLLDFHIFVVGFFAEMKSFLIEIEPYQPQVFLIYGVIVAPLVVGLFRKKVLKLRKHKLEKTCLDTVNGPPPSAKKPS